MGTLTDTFSEYLGVISRPIGLDGSFALSDAIAIPTTLGPGSVIGIGFSREFVVPYTIETYSHTPTRTVMRVRGICAPEAVQALVERAVYIQTSAIQVEAEDRYSIGDIVGCAVMFHDEGGARSSLGIVTDVLLLPANDVWEVRTPDGSEVLLPVIDDVVLSVDVVNKVIMVRLIPGLLEPDTDE